MRAGDNATRGAKGVVAFDVDGVLLRQLFLYRIALRRGLWPWLRALWLGFLFKVGAVSVRGAVERAYRLLRGMSIDAVVGAGESLRLTTGAHELCAELRQAGYLVVLVSAGVPQPVVERIAGTLGADGAWGVLLEVSDGALTGRLTGDRHSEQGKRRGLERFLRSSGFGWGETTVVVDDRSNAEIVEAAWRSIAVNPELPILKRASFVLHTRDLREILEFFPEGYRWGITPQWLAVRHEVFRKGIHACAVTVPVIAAWSKPFALLLVGSVTLFYAVSEVLRLIGVALPIFSAVTWRAMRSMESRGVVLGPLLFGLGIWLALAVFSTAAATAGVLILAIGDGAASLVGKAFGRTPLQHNPLKTFEGSLALFAVAVAIAAFFVSLPWALVVGAVACLLESLPTGPADNLLLPLGTAGVVAVATAVGPR